VRHGMRKGRSGRLIRPTAGGLGLEPRLQGSKGLRAADYPIPHPGPAQPTDDGLTADSAPWLMTSRIADQLLAAGRPGHVSWLVTAP
jgi:hypothetical protein